MSILERIFTLLGRAIRYSPAAALATVIGMIVIVPVVALSFGLLFVAAGGDWSWSLFSTLLVGGFLVGLVLVGAILFRISGVENARLKWITLVITIVMAGILFKGIKAIPTAGPLWTTILWSGFGAVVAGTVLLVLLGTVRPARPLFTIGVVLLIVGALSGAGKWMWSESKKSSAVVAPIGLQFCWSKPEDVTGGMSGIRGKCCPAQFNAFNGGLVNFSVFHFYGGAQEEQVYTLNRAEKVGTWKNNGKLPGRGTWEEMPTPAGTSVKLIGRYRDETEDNQWISFMIVEKSS